MLTKLILLVKFLKNIDFLKQRVRPRHLLLGLPQGGLYSLVPWRRSYSLVMGKIGGVGPCRRFGPVQKVPSTKIPTVKSLKSYEGDFSKLVHALLRYLLKRYN